MMGKYLDILKRAQRDKRIALQVAAIIEQAVAEAAQIKPQPPKPKWSDFDDRSNWSFR